jgi:predicted membrane protein
MRAADQPPDFRITPRLVVGLGIMLAGLVMALDSLGLLDAGRVLSFWPLVLIAVGVVKVMGPPEHRHGSLVWFVAGVGLLLVTLGYMPFSRLWAVLLFFVGASIAWRAIRPPLPRALGSGDALDLTAVLGGAKSGSTSRDFRGGSATATLGGCEVDLRHASIADGQEAVLDVFAFWGGIGVRVPEDWEVVNRVTTFLGGFENKTLPTPGANKRFVIQGTAIMGGVEVKN